MINSHDVSWCGVRWSYLQPQNVQHLPLLPLTWADVPLGEVVVPGQHPIDLPGGPARGGPEAPDRGGPEAPERRSPDAPDRGSARLTGHDPARKFPN